MSYFQTNPHADLMLQTCHFIICQQHVLGSNFSSLASLQVPAFLLARNVRKTVRLSFETSFRNNCHIAHGFKRSQAILLNIAREAFYYRVKQYVLNIAPERITWRQCNRAFPTSISSHVSHGTVSNSTCKQQDFQHQSHALLTFPSWLHTRVFWLVSMQAKIFSGPPSLSLSRRNSFLRSVVKVVPWDSDGEIRR